MFGLFKKNKDNNIITLKAPVVGKCMNISEVPDEVFASKMLGDGIGFESTDGVLYAPVDGEILQVFPTKHAVVLKTKEGVEILLHIGIDTVSMKGEGFESHVSQGSNVKVGDKLVSFNVDLIKEKAKSHIGPMVITENPIIESMEFNYGSTDKNSDVVTIKLKK